MHLNPTSRSAAVLAAAASLFLLPLSGPAPAAAAAAGGTTRYLDCSAASNGDGGQATPWNSLATANAYVFGPGDRLLLKRGTTCTGTLKPQGSGSAAAPVTLAAYGTGTDRPVVAGSASSTEKAAVHLYNVEQWEIRDLEITFKDTAATKRERNGLLVEVADLPDGVGTHYVVDDVYVHDVNGDATKWSNGIQFRVSGTTTPTNFDDVLVQNSRIDKVDREGLTNRTTWMCRPQYGAGDDCGTKKNWRASTRLVFRGNTISNTGGDGIVLRAADHGLVEHNTAYDLAMRPMGYNAGIWTINSDDSLIQYNEVHHVRRLPDNGDGMAFDSDYGNNRAVFQFNHSHDNEGGFMLFCGACGSGSSSTGTVVRYNLSHHDKDRWLASSGEDSADLYQNTVYFAAGSTADIVQDGYGTTHARFTNNVFHNLGTGGFDGLNNQGTYHPAEFTWAANTFFGNHPANEPADPEKKTYDPQFVNAGGSSPADYKLAAGSPVRGTGTTIPTLGGKDYFGSPLPQVCRPDRGFHQASVFDDSACSPVNAVRNSGFENTDLNPWTSYGGVTLDTGTKHSGSRAVKVGPAQAAAEQIVQVKPGTSYTLAGWGKVSASGTELSLGAKQYDATASTSTVFTSTAFTQRSTTFTTGPTATTAKIYCYARTGTGYGWCDDITLQEN
ncbi:right-handed parallel beta-helix repeat-containing protein [Kitasatospora purpeofusca]|uniref:carbohydrate binding domain-containing protein n=1 Tax=Kitasatospora purpeofusca TaxID=67352 RepID=UPI002E137962|nr:carbohydrate binding domain-containing protein [Kitasatospora purpeofusca]WSR44878.1 right-handed parallel beta-helix repeat-containing protein [Kitasatospora purpeofusca]